VYHTRTVATITSRQHGLVKEFRRVAAGDTPLALLDGWHLLEDAIRARLAIETIAVVPETMTPATQRLLERARDAGTTVVAVSPNVLEALSPVRSPTGVVGLAQRRVAMMSQLLTPAPALIVLAVDMQDPGNVGAVIRSAEAGGATGVALAGASADAWGWKALRAAMGSTFRLPIVTAVSAATILEELRRAGVNVFASVPRSGTTMDGTDFRKATAFVIGGEGPGLASDLVQAANARVSIPMKSPVESVNAAVAAALLVFEARRQREVRS
jgi:TrmH family RNA methyltransferase